MLLILTFAFLVGLSRALPKDTVIQFERRVLGNGTVVERVFASPAPLKGQLDNTRPDVRPVQDEVLKMLVENDQDTRSYGTYIRLRECKLRGYRVLQLSDRFQLNGRDFLTLDPETDLWTMSMPELQDLKKSGMLEAKHSRLEKIHLKEECEDVMQQMNHSQGQEGHGLLRVMALILTTFLFIGFVFMSYLIYKRYGQQPGGVLGSIIHYPAHHFDVSMDGQSLTNVSDVPVLRGHY